MGAEWFIAKPWSFSIILIHSQYHTITINSNTNNDLSILVQDSVFRRDMARLEQLEAKGGDLFDLAPVREDAGPTDIMCAVIVDPFSTGALLAAGKRVIYLSLEVIFSWWLGRDWILSA